MRMLSTSGGLLPLRVRRLDRVRLRVDLTMLVQLASALARLRRSRWLRK
jgi:hypothetical protein